MTQSFSRPMFVASLTLASLIVVRDAAGASNSPRLDQIRAWTNAHQRDLMTEFTTLLAIPNVASDSTGIERNAETIASMMERRQLSPRLLRLTGETTPPLVVGEWKRPGAKAWLTYYAHYDGQPVDPKQWSTPPWEPVLHGEDGKTLDWRTALSTPAAVLPPEARLYARSTGDDKAAVFGLLAAVDALRAAGGMPGVNLRFVFEGEEEAGSPHLAALLDQHSAELRTNAWILCDGPLHPSRRPEVFFGARGVVGLELTVYGANHGLHSGHYGNWAPDPTAMLVHLLDGMRDEEGAITIDGFYDEVRPLSASERAALAEVPDVDDALRKELGIARSLGLPERLAERIQRPALNLHGLEAGRVGALASNTVQAEARASIDFRLVPDQTLAGLRKAVERHLERRGWFLVSAAPDAAIRLAHARIVRLEWGAGYPAARTALDLPLAQQLVASVSAAAGVPVVRMPMLGGSIPMVIFQGKDHQIPVVGLPIANHDDNQHTQDENLRLQNLWDGIAAYAAAFAGIDEHAFTGR
ncbi:MAG: M20/M25/M40 family metallo-hydrolase [Acidobacteriota bacterium]